MPRFAHSIFIVLCLTSLASAAVDRVLRKFDFEERAAGNMEDVPMDWVKIEGPGQPHYVNGGLTTEQAFAGRYSFGFKLNGGSLVYRYPAGRIAVHGDAHYHARVMAKTHGLVNARVQMTAYFAGVDGVPIRASLKRSTPAAGEAWQPLDLSLTAPADAASVVIELALVQSSVWRQASLGASTVYEQDIDGQAWFDELTIAQVPDMRLATSAAGNVFRRGEPAVIDVSLNDRVTDDLTGRLDVTDDHGRTAYQRTGALELAANGTSNAARVALPTLPAGWYRAAVTFSSGTRTVARQTIDFVQLADDAPAIDSDGRFGVIATAVRPAAWGVLPELLPLVGASRVKLGVWTPTVDAEKTDGAFEKLIDRLHGRDVLLTACLLAPPPDVARLLPDASWTQLARGTPDAWQPKLSGFVSRYSGSIERWQFCDDDRAVDLAARGDLRAAYGVLGKPVRALIGPGDFALPWPVYADPPVPVPGSLTLSVPTDVLPPHLPLYVTREKAKSASLSLKFLDSVSYGRDAQLRDLAQRIGFAVATGMPRIDLPLPFSAPPDRPGDFEPADTYLATRTLLGALAGATYQGRMPLGDDIEALLFDRNGEGVLLAWTKSPQAAPQTVSVMLGNLPRVIDLDGNLSAVLKPRAADGTTDVVIGPTPSLLVGIDGGLARLRSSFAFDNPMLESSYKPHVRRLKFANPFPSPITGRLSIKGPAGWTFTPLVPQFSLAAGEAYDNAVTIEFPFSSVAGNKPVELTVQVDGGVTFKVPLTMRLGLSDLGVETSAFRDGDDVVVQQMITNYGSRPADYTAFASFPGSARQERMINALAPGTTTIKRYRFPNAGGPAKAVVRSGVRETQGTRTLTDEVPLQ